MSKKAFLGAVLPFITNPFVLAAVGVGAAGWAVYEIFSDKDAQENGTDTVPDGSEPLLEPLDNEELAVEGTVIEPLETVDSTAEETVGSAVEEPSILGIVDDCEAEQEQVGTVDEEDQKKELIRQAMSELGKRSAAARANRKNK